MFENREEVEALADADRVSDPSTVYDDVDALPGWWRDLVIEFAEYDLRPYRPSRLADGAITYEVVEALEDRFDVSIAVKSDGPAEADRWRFDVDGTPALTATHERKPEGFTRYGVTREELVEAVSAVVSERPDR